MAARSEQADRLIDLIREYFDRTGISATVDEDSGTVTTAEGAVFGLINLLQQLRSVPDEEWEAFVADWFDRLVRAATIELPSEYRLAAPRLRVRLVPRDKAELYGEMWVMRPVADDLCQALMVKIEAGACNVAPQQIEAWGVQPDQIWRDARERTLWDEPRERSVAVKPTGERFVWVRGSKWVSSLLLDLDRFVRSRNRFGALAAIPCNDVLMYHEIRDPSAVASSVGMAELAVQFYYEGPGSLSPHLYWWRDGVIRKVVSVEGGRMNKAWGPEFSEMLAGLERHDGRRPPGRR